MDITYHLVPKKFFDSTSPAQDYVPAEFAQDGFIHCTDGEFLVSSTAYNIYTNLNDELLVLFIDKSLVKSPIRFDTDEKVFPHIYGPLNRNAIVKIASMKRDRRGHWIFPIQEILG